MPVLTLNQPLPVRLIADQTLPNGHTVRAGSLLYVLRDYVVNAGRERRLSLGDYQGRVTLPCVNPEDVTGK